MNSPATGAFDQDSSSSIPSIFGAMLTGMAYTVFLPSCARMSNGIRKEMKRRKPVFFMITDGFTNILEVF
jgi:hypothetical protein